VHLGGLENYGEEGTAMKTVRRLTVEIERRLLLIQRGGSVGADAPIEHSAEEKSKGDCPDCGSPWVLLHDGKEAGQKGLPADVHTLRDIHLHSSPSGQLWICQRSLQRFISRKSKETL
jgi:hypothetical protein